jgi:pectinesterase
VIFVVGDSTSSVYQHSERPRAGWGQALPLLLGPQAGVFDYAWSGPSSKSFADAGLLAEVLDLLQPGDYLLISFGHNDEKVEDPARGTDPQTTFKEYLQKYLDGAAAKGAQAVLVTPVERRRFSPLGLAQDSHGAYPQAVRDLAAATGTPLVGPHRLVEGPLAGARRRGNQNLLPAYGTRSISAVPERVADNTHFQAEGALAVAKLAASELQAKQTIPPGYFQLADTTLDPLAGIYWPGERPVDKPLVLDVGRGLAFRTVQAAVGSVPAGTSRRALIRIQPGIYREAIRVPADKPRVSFIGLGESAEDVVLVYNNASGTPKPDGSGSFGTGGSASVRIDGPDFTAANLTFSNDFDEAANQHIANRQAVALFLTGDRAVLHNVRCLGNQDTLLVDSPARGVPARFSSVAVMWKATWTSSLAGGRPSFQTAGSGPWTVLPKATTATCPPGARTARSSTGTSLPVAGLSPRLRRDRCTWAGPGIPAATWTQLPGPCPDSWLGAHISGTPWTDMSGFSWAEARFHEFNNHGPGARITPDRPQLGDGAGRGLHAGVLSAGNGRLGAPTGRHPGGQHVDRRSNVEAGKLSRTRRRAAPAERRRNGWPEDPCNQGNPGHPTPGKP